MEQCSKRDDSDIAVPFPGTTVKQFHEWLLGRLAFTDFADFTQWRDLMVFAHYFLIETLSKCLIGVVADLLVPSEQCFSLDCSSLMGAASEKKCVMKEHIRVVSRAFVFGQKHRFPDLAYSIFSLIESKLRPRSHFKSVVEKMCEPCDCLICTGQLTNV
jgi:hypothetical protein